jgi:excisionase family DNA binding protein
MILTSEQVAEMLKIKLSKLKFMVFKKQIKSVRLGRSVRFKLTDVEEFIKNL